MSDMHIAPSSLAGTVRVPSSKSVCHRAVICAGLAEGTSKITGVLLSDDIIATMKAMEALGAVIHQENDTLIITGTNCIQSTPLEIACNESGSTLRFLIPLGLNNQTMTFTGKGQLVERPLHDYFNIFDKQQIAYQTTDGHLPLSVTGALKPGEFRLRGDVSSQFVSGLLFALPRLPGDSSIIITTEMESKGYIDLTLSMLKRFGIKIINNNYREFIVPGNQKYQSTDYCVEGDYSQVAFWLVAGTLGNPVRCTGLDPHSLQGDKVIIDLIEQMGGKLKIETDSITASPAITKSIVIDASQCPDLVPILTVLAAVSDGTTQIIRAGRLRIKECDRLKAIAQELNKLGADIQENEDSLTINGRPCLTGGVVHSWHDHRIAMALAIASVACQTPVTIKHSECVSKSYPDFWQDFHMLGGKNNERHVG
ncbi:3-phosphoshikimate 1-carboxyvinyltransferase [Pelosinus sp. sgz500959]|uniref:3-phosphoshikimate 1-carboxyvinyltransferase n=1 Tax=Pelosinus sp. sgz500959 TaxID=3242472 RepID=UPI00366E4964